MSSDYFRVMLSVDALGWTSHWLDSGDRCDLLAVDIARNDAVQPRFRFTAVESKARSQSDPIACRDTTEPFPKAIAQVVATLNAVEKVLRGDGKLIDDLKRTALFQFIISEALSTLSHQSDPDPDATFIVATLNELSGRDTPYKKIKLEKN